MLSIQKLNVGYGNHPVLKDLDLEVQANTIHGILGMNGAGKTTFFNSIYGIINKATGDILLNEAIVKKQDIAYLETHNFFYSFLKGREYLELFALHNKTFTIDDWNELFQLPLNDMIDTYSTGMKKKLAFMGILALDKPILFLDEPFNGIDVESHERMVQVILRLKDQGKHILISSHIIQTLTNICDRISWLRDGNFQRTYEQGDFNSLEEEIRRNIVEKMGDTLEKLF